MEAGNRKIVLRDQPGQDYIGQRKQIQSLRIILPVITAPISQIRQHTDPFRSAIFIPISFIINTRVFS